MSTGSSIMLVITILAVTTVSTVLYASADPADITYVNLANDRPVLLPLAANITFTFGIVPPVRNFLDRITKKTFGLFITRDTSPVENDRFAGYHTGVDAEFTDATGDVPVYAIADGTIVIRTWSNGYGGVIVIKHTINGVELYALYGHLDEASFPPAQVTRVTAGQQIAVLGDDHSQQTDGVRKHLHFSLSTTDKLDIRGYVKTEEELSHWLDPLDFYQR